MLKAVIFDIDGTLIDSVALHAQAWQEALEHHGVEVPLATLRRQIGQGADKILAGVAPGLKESQYGDVDGYRSKHFKTHYLDRVKGFPDVPGLFRKLQALGVRLALGSSARGDELDAYRRIAGIDGFETVNATADDAKASKPAPDIFAAVVRKLQLEPQDCVVVGDSVFDITAAKRAGIPSVGVLGGEYSADELREAGARQVYGGPSALLDALSRTGVSALQ